MEAEEVFTNKVLKKFKFNKQLVGLVVVEDSWINEYVEN